MNGQAGTRPVNTMSPYCLSVDYVFDEINVIPYHYYSTQCTPFPETVNEVVLPHPIDSCIHVMPTGTTKGVRKRT